MKTMASSIFILLLPTLILSCIFSLDEVGSFSPQNANNITLTEFTKLNFPPNVSAVGSLTFDVLGGGPYAGTVDGRIFRYSKLFNRWFEYGYTSPNRTRAFCDGTMGFDRSPVCGYTSGLSFQPLTQFFYACDAYVGLTLVGYLGGEAVSTLVGDADVIPPLRYPISVDAASDGMVYFVDASSVYDPKDGDTSRKTGDSTGRLFQYNPETKNLTLLLSELGRAVSVVTNSDASFVLVSESNKNRIRRYYLKGDKAGSDDIFLTFGGGAPNKIKRNQQDGSFWVGVDFLKAADAGGEYAPRGVKLSPRGEILGSVDLSHDYRRRIHSVAQQGDYLFVAGNHIGYVGRYKLKQHAA